MKKYIFKYKGWLFSTVFFRSFGALMQVVAALLLEQNGTVTVCHSRTKNLAEITSKADILVAAVGRAGFVTADMVKDGAVVVDVGINRDENGKMCGDINPEAYERAAAYTPVPGGIGPMTVAMLMNHVVLAAEMEEFVDVKDI